MQSFGIIGKNLEHTFSKDFFTNFFIEKNINANYTNYNLATELELETFLKTTSCNFFNVTIPYKISIQKYLHQISPIAKKINAVNCIKKIDGNWYGTNTDAVGFEQSFLKKLNPQIHTAALVLGNGGAANAAIYVLKKNNIPIISITRNMQIGSINFADVDESILNKYKIIINTTPLGMYPNFDSMPPLPYQYITADNYLFDLVYNPEETNFLKYAKNVGATYQNGLEMLHLQALAAYDWWMEK